MDLKYKLIKGRKVYEITDSVCKKMLARSAKAMQNTYPEANKGYAVTLLTNNGNFYDGVSYGSDTATLTMHSEAVALANAALHGEKAIVAITGPNCHICKQLIWESSLRSGIETLIVMEGKDAAIEKVPISEVMPFPWPDVYGNK